MYQSTEVLGQIKTKFDKIPAIGSKESTIVYISERLKLENHSDYMPPTILKTDETVIPYPS